MMTWIKVYYEARYDIKLCRLTPMQHLVWFNLLLFSAQQEDRGVIVSDDFELLAIEVSRADEDALRDALVVLLKFKMISYTEHEGVHTIIFLKFEERQYDKPSDAPEATRLRKQRSRETQKESVSRPVTPLSRPVTPCHAQTERQIQRQNREDIETEQNRDRTETEQSAAPIPTEPDQVSVPSVSVPSFGTGAFPVPSPEPARQQPARHNPDWHLTEADIRDLLKSKWTRQQIEWGVQIGIESGTKPRNARSVLHASILPDVAEGKRPGSATANAPPSPPPAPPMSPEGRAKLDADIADQTARIQRANLARLAREAEQNGTGTN
jgi:hypothetical protein